MTTGPLVQETLGSLATVGYTPLNVRDPDLDPLGKCQALTSHVT